MQRGSSHMHHAVSIACYLSLRILRNGCRLAGGSRGRLSAHLHAGQGARREAARRRLAQEHRVAARPGSFSITSAA